MKNLLFFSMMLFSFSLPVMGGATEELVCMESLAEYLSVIPDQELEFDGETEGRACEVSIRYDKWISGITKEETRSLNISVVEHKKKGSFKKFVSSYLTYNSNLRELKIYTCQQNRTQFVLHYRDKAQSGWKKKKYYKVILDKKDDATLSFYTREKGRGYKKEARCSVKI